MVTPEKVIRIISKEHVCEVTIAHHHDSYLLTTADMMAVDLDLQGQEITRDEFAKEFEIASRLIVLDP